MKRPMLVSGITILLSAALFLTFGKTAAVVSCAAGATVFVLYLVFKKKLKAKYIIPTLCLSLILSSAAFLTFEAAEVEKCKMYDGITCNIYGKITELPSTYGKADVYTVKAESVNGKKVSFKFTYFDYRHLDLKLYDVISIINGKLVLSTDTGGEIKNFAAQEKTFLSLRDNDGIQKVYSDTKTPYYYCLHLKEMCLEKIETHLQGDVGAVLSGMIFGETESIGNQTLLGFRRSGVAHLLAVSGLHTSLWCGLLGAFLSLFGLSEKKKGILSLLFLVFLCVIAGFTPSVLRASFMTALVLIAPFFKRQTDSYNSLGFAVTVLVLFNPYIITSAGFLMSVSATAGVIFSKEIATPKFFLPKKERPALIKKLVYFVTDTVKVSLTAGLFLIPATASFFGTFCLIAPFTNLFAVQLGFYGMVIGLFAVLLTCLPFSFIPAVSAVLFAVPRFIITVLIKLVTLIGDFKYATLPVTETEGFVLTVLSLLIVAFVLFLKKKPTLPKSKKSLIAVPLAISFILTLVFPLFPLKYNCELTVVSCGNDPVAVLRCGTDYALINTPYYSDYFENTEDALPKTKAEKLDFLFVADSYNFPLYSFSYFDEAYTPDSIILPQDTFEKLLSGEIKANKSHRIKTANKQMLGEFTVETVDTYPMNYVIIYCNEKRAVISLYEGNDTELFLQKYGTPDIFILSPKEAAALKETVDTLIVFSGEEIMTSAGISSAENKCNYYYETFFDGNISVGF